MVKFKTETGNSVVIEAVKRAEEQRLTAMRANDAVTLKKLLADDLVYVFSTGFAENKVGYLTALEDGATKYEDDLHIQRRRNPSIFRKGNINRRSRESYFVSR